MRRTWDRVVLLVWVCTVLLGYAAMAEEAQPQQPCVLVLPLQASPEMSGDQVFLGLAVQHVLEHVLAVHSGLEECWLTSFLRQVFPDQQALRDWVQGTGKMPAAVPELGLRYLLTGQVRLQGDAVQVTLELLDRATGNRVPSTVTVDFPRLESLRTGFIELLALAGLPVPAPHKPAMLWPEEISLTAFTLLGQGLYRDLVTLYNDAHAVAHPQPFAEVWQWAPHSYLVLNKLGWVAYQQQRHTEAVRLFAQALAINPAGVDAADGMTVNGIVTGNETLKEAWIAHKAKIQGQEAQRPPAALWLQRGTQFAHNGDYPHAIVAYEQELALQRAIKDRTGQGRTLNHLGIAYLALSQYERAVSYHEQALTIAREVQDRAMESHTLNNLGMAYYWLQADRALDYAEQALTIAREVQDRGREGDALNTVGKTYYALSQYEQAVGYHEQALTIAREVQDRGIEAYALAGLARAYRDLGQNERAVGYFEQALTITHEAKDQAAEVRVLVALGWTYQRLSQYEQAIGYAEQALAIGGRIKNREIGAQIVLGSAYQALGQNEQAARHYERVLAIAREIKNRSGESDALHNLGEIYNELGQYERAIGFYEQALAIAREIKDRGSEGITLNKLGEPYRALGQYESAIHYHEQALAIVRAVKDRAEEGDTLNNLGRTYQELGQYERTIDFYEQALAIGREVKHRAGEGSTLSHLMGAWKARQAPRLAIFYGKQAVNVYQAIRRNLHPLDKVLQRSFLTSKTGTYRTLADLLITAGRLPEAQQVLDLLKAEEYFDFVRRDAQAAGELQHATLTPEESVWEQRYRTIADRVTALGVERQTLLAKPSRTAEDDTRLDMLEDDLTVAAQAFQQFLRGLEEAFRGTPEGSARLAQVREAQGLMADLADLGPGTVALYTLVSEKAYRVILITPNTQAARDYSITAADLNRKVLAFREALRTPLVDPRPLAQELYQILVAPVAHDLKGAQAQTLMWSLDGVLRYLPMTALHDGEAYLVERYRHVMFTPASQARLKDAPQATWTGLGLGVSQAHGDFAALPGVVEELQGIIRDESQTASTGVLPGALKLDAAFTAQAMRAALRQHYPVVHIASHFHFRPGNETASFLLLGDGSHLLLSELKTWPNIFAGVDLLTLSACDTAMGNAAGDGKEVEGFGVLAQRQGAKAVIATLWPVADASTTALMQELYQRHATQPGLPKIEALRQAQLTLLQGQQPGKDVVAQGKRGLIGPVVEHSHSRTSALPRFPWNPRAPYAHPFYWAPFILIGNWK